MFTDLVIAKILLVTCISIPFFNCMYMYHALVFGNEWLNDTWQLSIYRISGNICVAKFSQISPLRRHSQKFLSQK